MTISAETFKLLDRYGIPLVGLVVLSIVSVILFNKLEASLVRYEQYAQIAHQLMTEQQQRDSIADTARNNASKERARNQALILLGLQQQEELYNLITTQEMISSVETLFFMQGFNVLLEAQGENPIFPMEDMKKLQQHLQEAILHSDTLISNKTYIGDMYKELME